MSMGKRGTVTLRGMTKKLGITYRLFLAILAAAVLSVASMFLIMQLSIDRGFLRYVNTMEHTRLARLAERLAESYERALGWNFLGNDPDGWRRFVAASLPDEAPGPPEGRRDGEHPPPPPGDAGHPPDHPPPGEVRNYVMRVFLLDARKQPLYGPGSFPASVELVPVSSPKGVVGYLGLLPHRRLSDERQLRFLKEQKLALGLVGGVVLLLATGLSFPLANRLVRPVRALAAATGRLAAGEFATRVPVMAHDELGLLARDFNELAHTLERNEQLRRQWVADISHELRTPLAIIRGEIEALQDGVRQPTPAAIDSLHGEALRLGRLVDDLNQLSLSDLGALTYRKVELDLAEVLDAALAQYRQEFAARQIAVDAHIPAESKVLVYGDRERLRQLLTNLLDNSLTYTDPGGKLDVRLACRDGEAVLDIEDSAPGVPAEELERLFDRFYRVESSRNRAAGGAGLGLAICRNIVLAHAGTIEARESSLGGVGIRVILPLAGK